MFKFRIFGVFLRSLGKHNFLFFNKLNMNLRSHEKTGQVHIQSIQNIRRV